MARRARRRRARVRARKNKLSLTSAGSPRARGARGFWGSRALGSWTVQRALAAAKPHANASAAASPSTRRSFLAFASSWMKTPVHTSPAPIALTQSTRGTSISHAPVDEKIDAGRGPSVSASTAFARRSAPPSPSSSRAAAATSAAPVSARSSSQLSLSTSSRPEASTASTCLKPSRRRSGSGGSLSRRARTAPPRRRRRAAERDRVKGRGRRRDLVGQRVDFGRRDRVRRVDQLGGLAVAQQRRARACGARHLLGDRIEARRSAHPRRRRRCRRQGRTRPPRARSQIFSASAAPWPLPPQ